MRHRSLQPALEPPWLDEGAPLVNILPAARTSQRSFGGVGSHRKGDRHIGRTSTKKPPGGARRSHEDG